MRTTSRRAQFLRVAWIAAAALGPCAGRADAQFGMGMGMGMGGGGMGIGLYGGGFVPYIQQPSNYFNQLSVSRAPAALMVKTYEANAQRHPYANDPNAYINHVRDNGFVDQYSIDRSAPVYFRRGMAAPAPRRRPRAVLTGAQAGPVATLTSFYNEKDALVWPADAPDAPELTKKREIFDQASRTVLREMKSDGVASIAAVADARQKLLDYGRPALKHVRAHDTARIADGFHKFLLDLYDSLARAAIPSVAEATAPASPTPSSAPAAIAPQPAAPAPAPEPLAPRR